MNYKNSILVFLFVSASASAQSTVTLYGVVDDGLVWSSNQHGSSALQLEAGISKGDRWGLLGNEDLGGGLSSLFRIEFDFNGNSGSLSPGRTYVGLASRDYGTVTLGRQGETIGDYIGPFSANGTLPGGILFPHPGDMDNNGVDFHVNNALKYETPTFGGLTGVAMYSFGGVAGNVATDSAKSFALQYAAGNVQLAGAYTDIDHPAVAVPQGVWTPSNTVDGNYGIAAGDYKVFGLAGAYSFGSARISMDWTHTIFADLDPALGARISGHVNFDIAEVVVSYFLTPAVQLGAAYSYTLGHVSATGQKPHYNELDASVDYFLSKQTDVYVTGTYMRAGGGVTADLAPVLAASSNSNQVAVQIGLRKRF